jgi:hypothetical protein
MSHFSMWILLEWAVAIQGAAKIWGAGAEFRVERDLLKSSILKINFNKMLSKPQSTCGSTEHVG